MFDLPRTASASVTIFYPDITNLSEKIGRANKALSEKYYPAQEFSKTLPDVNGAQKIYLFASIHGNSQIVVTPSNIALTVNFTEDWMLDAGKCFGYLNDRKNLLFEAMANIDSGVPFQFVGAMARTVLFSSGSDEAVSDRLRTRLLPDTSPGQLNDFLQKVTTIGEELFFENTTTSLFRSWDTVTAAISNPRFSLQRVNRRGVIVEVDVNSRHAYNEDLECVVDKDLATRLVAQAQEVGNRQVTILQGSN